MQWDDLRHFLALSRTGSVRGAGARLGVSHSTVARRVEALEDKLVTRLFDRHRDGYTLTEAGRQMLPRAERVEAEMCALERGLVGQDERLAGPVSITCCDEYVSEMVLTDLTELCTTHAGIELMVTADSRPFDLSKREADIAIRTLGVGQEPPPHLIGQRLVPVVTANYVARAHAVRLDPARGSSDARWVSFDDRSFFERMVAASSYPEVPCWGAFGSLGLMLQAVRAGLGFAMLPCYVADRDPALQRLESADQAHRADLWLVSHPDLRGNARLQAARACVREALVRRAALFRGTDA